MMQMMVRLRMLKLEQVVVLMLLPMLLVLVAVIDVVPNLDDEMIVHLQLVHLQHLASMLGSPSASVVSSIWKISV